jgi:hypothetical protein
VARHMTKGETHHAAVHYMGSQNLLFRDGAATITENVPAQTFSVDCAVFPLGPCQTVLH